jgi:predicted nucleic acid-binding protein
MRRAVFDGTVLVSAFLCPGGLSDELLVLAARSPPLRETPATT